jgi:hypothetical protein
MSSSSSTAASAAQRSTLLPWAAAGLVGAAVIIVFGNTGVDHAKGENGGLGPALATAVFCVLLAAVLFLGVLPRYDGTRTQVTLAVLTVLSLVVFWSGAPAVLGAATASISRRPSGSFTVAGWVGIVAAALAVVWTVVDRFI